MTKNDRAVIADRELWNRMQTFQSVRTGRENRDSNEAAGLIHEPKPCSVEKSLERLF
jgi:hypothetical protein